jgi:alpha-mannosidase II
MRIRKKITLIVCASCFGIFLFLYLLIGRAIKPEPKSELLYLQSKLSQLEQGLNKHHNEVDAIRKAINGIQHNQISADYKDLLALAHDKPRDLIDGGDMKELLIDTNLGSSDRQHCSFRDNVVPEPDIQMLDIYREIPFDNVDGGPWKQGWRVDYDPKEWNRHHKLKVFVVPHSHNDPGWISTFDEYYERSTKLIFANMLRHLDENEGFKFIWAEISYFAKWYDKLAEESQKTVRKLVQRRQLEFVTGGWVMPDEANSHWFSILQQLTEGQTWLKNAFNITPISAWAIDPFGHSPVMPYILKNSGFENMLIQRTHYSVKKRFAQKKELEFRWRQLWDSNGDTELFTHMMPFYSYDVPHTCGPDPKICCQFDFKRLPGYGLSCPWRIAPQVIDSNNVAKK